MLIAKIREEDCIGCGKCISACPVDAIVGAPTWMHGVLVDECIGCKLCLAPCPMDCIEMVQPPQPPFKGGSDEEMDGLKGDVARATKAKARYIARKNRLIKKQKPLLMDCNRDPEYKIKIQREIVLAVARVKAKRNEQQKKS